MPYSTFLNDLQKEAEELKVTAALEDVFTELELSLTYLSDAFKEILINKETINEECEDAIHEALCMCNFSARNLCDILVSYTKTHNNQKPIGSLQMCIKAIQDIECVFREIRSAKSRIPYLIGSRK